MIRYPGEEQYQRIVPVTFPEVLSRSRDYNLIEMVLFIIFKYFYQLSTEIKNVHNPEICDVSLLPLLADYYRYEYTEVESVDLERQIIANVPNLHHYKGTSIGIDNAINLSKVDKTDGVSLNWTYDSETNTVTVILYSTIEVYKLYKLLKLVVPLGTKIVFKNGRSINISDELEMHSWVDIGASELKPNKQNFVTPNNTWKTEWNPDDEKYHIYVDYQYHIGDDNLEIYKVNETTGNVEQTTSDSTAGTRLGNIEVASTTEGI